MKAKPADSYQVANVGEIDSPALLVYLDRVKDNVAKMIALAGGVERLRPHVKTHKLSEMVRMQMKAGIRKFKCATIAEAEMTAACGAADVLLAYQPTGPKVGRFIELTQRFPKTKFSAIADDEGAIRALAKEFSAAGVVGEFLLDIDCGQHRSGVAPDAAALELYRLIHSLPGLRVGGLHVYDGHIHDKELLARIKTCEAAFKPVNALLQKLGRANLPVPTVVAGGTPTFPVHARRKNVECSPGTCVFWDAGYEAKLPDLDFEPAALVLTRVVSKPATGRLCLDLGHKAIAAENPHPRVIFPGLPDAQAVTHSEEHLVVETARAAEFKVGDCLYGVPWHICPTVALHSEAVIIENGRATERWKIVARDRRLTI